MELSQQLLAVGLVLALLIVGAHLAQRRGWLRLNLPTRRRVSRHLELVGRLALTPQHQLHLVRIEGRMLLIATHAQGVEVVDSGSPQISAAARAGGRGGPG